ncbi:MAG TPA: hypothetical protein ENK57_23800 [Polyangiaceae bacterium]|nr:hypothetical protein [Polyangiaceae bacterium]
MQTHRRFRHIAAQVVGLGALAALYSPHPVASACSVAGPVTVSDILGLARVGAYDDLELPSNAAGFDLGGETFETGGATLTRVPEGTTSFTRPGSTLTVSGGPDLEAPRLDAFDQAVRVEQSACSGCAYGSVDTSTITLSLRATDDVAALEQLSFALYLGSTEEEASRAATDEPDFWLLVDREGALWTFLANDDASEFAVVRVFDQAGNASEPSLPVPITR